MPNTLEGSQRFAQQILDSDFTPPAEDHASMVAEFVEEYTALGGVIPTRVNLKSPFAWRQLMAAVASAKTDTPPNLNSTNAHAGPRPFLLDDVEPLALAV